MTREELTARLRKLTGKTADDIEALDERVDALEAGGSGGGGVSYIDVPFTSFTLDSAHPVATMKLQIPDIIKNAQLISASFVALDEEMIARGLFPSPMLYSEYSGSNPGTSKIIASLDVNILNVAGYLEEIAVTYVSYRSNEPLQQAPVVMANAVRIFYT